MAPGKPSRRLRGSQDNHPAISEILPAYQKAMEAARDFVKEQKLVSFPPKEELHVVHTPEFRRHEIPSRPTRRVAEDPIRSVTITSRL
jgi:hypothetical protein